MTDTASAAATREVVGLFASRDTFEAAVNALTGAGFDRSDLSVLSSHESLDAAGSPGKPMKDVLTALVGEIKYEVPLVASGAVLLVGGPMSAALAGIIGTATAGLALKEVVDEVTDTPHTEDFARSLEAGSIILWARVDSDARESEAVALMEANGGTNVHIHGSA